MELGLVTQEDLKKRSNSDCDVLILDLRREPRHVPVVSVTVCDATGQVSCVGSIHPIPNVSEHGLAVSGIDAQEGDTRRILVLGDDFGEVAPFEFQAVCRWTRRGASHEQPMAGFEITNISQKDSERLSDFIARFTCSL